MQDNLATYNSLQVVNWYNGYTGLMPVEKHVFETYIAGRKCDKLLDVGIGAGRTTAYLVNYCEKYTGIDYSENLVQKAKLKYSDLDLRCMNAADLSEFDNNRFDFVNFSFNGLDYATLNDRMKILSEIYRVLKPGAVFFFSTHNRNAFNFNKAPWFNRKNSLWINIKTFLKLLPFLPRHYSKKKHEVLNSDYAIINNCAHNYGLMTFHSTPELVKKQLESNYFCDVIFYNWEGKITDEKSTDEWLFIVCKKQANV